MAEANDNDTYIKIKRVNLDKEVKQPDEDGYILNEVRNVVINHKVEFYGIFIKKPIPKKPLLDNRPVNLPPTPPKK